MWTDESLSEAMRLIGSSEQIERVETDESMYVVANGVPYIDELYLNALDELIRQGKLKLLCEIDGRAQFASC